MKKNLISIKKAFLGSPLNRLRDFLIENGMKSIALNEKIPYKWKKSLAEMVCENERITRDSASELSFLQILGRPCYTPVHLYNQEWGGIDYKIWEEKDLVSKSSLYTTFFPGIRFPNFTVDISLTPKETELDSSNFSIDRFLLDGIIESSVWQNVLYLHPLFMNRERYKRPSLSDERTFSREIPYKGIPETVRVPLFETDSLASANSEARAIVEVFQDYGKSIEELVKLLKTDNKIRKEFLDTTGELETQNLLKKNGLNISILPRVMQRRELSHESISYTIYEVKGGSLNGSDHQRCWGFIHGIQFPDFSIDLTLSEKGRMVAQDTLELIFKYALYNDPYFRPQDGIIHQSTPRLIGKNAEESRIAGIKISGGKTVPFASYPDVPYLKGYMETTIHVYNKYRKQVDEITEKLPKMQREIMSKLGGLQVHNLSDSVAEILAKHGARFIIENPHHIERKSDIESW